MWIPIEQGLLRHPKTIKLKKLLKCSQQEAIGYLIFLWHWVSNYAPNGDVSKFEPDIIADGCEWKKEPEKFMSALIKSGFILEDCGKKIINDWNKHAGKYLKKAEVQAERMRVQRAKNKELQQNGDSQNNNVNVTLCEQTDNNSLTLCENYGKIVIDNNIQEKKILLLTTTKENFQPISESPGENETQEENYISQIADYYTHLTGRPMNHNDYVSVTGVLNSDLLPDFPVKLKIIKQCMSELCSKNGKKIHAFAYFSNKILDEFEKYAAKNNRKNRTLTQQKGSDYSDNGGFRPVPEDFANDPYLQG